MPAVLREPLQAKVRVRLSAPMSATAELHGNPYLTGLLCMLLLPPLLLPLSCGPGGACPCAVAD